MFLERKISILELFLKDHHVTLKTGENGCWKFNFAITGIHIIL